MNGQAALAIPRHPQLDAQPGWPEMNHDPQGHRRPASAHLSRGRVARLFRQHPSFFGASGAALWASADVDLRWSAAGHRRGDDIGTLALVPENRAENAPNQALTAPRGCCPASARPPRLAATAAGLGPVGPLCYTTDQEPQHTPSSERAWSRGEL
jgi:hypothetical protein